MCQAKKDGGSRCAYHLKVEIDRLEQEENAYFVESLGKFMSNSPEIENNPLVVSEYKHQMENIHSRKEFYDITTKDDVLEAHANAMEAKQLRDESLAQSSSHYNIGSSLKSFKRVFTQHNDASVTEKAEAHLNELYQAGKLPKNPEGAIKSYYFAKSAVEEYVDASHRYNRNGTPENRERLRAASLIRKKAERNLNSYGLRAMPNNGYEAFEKAMDKQDPGVSVYQHNYEYEVEQFNKVKTRFADKTIEEKEKREKYAEIAKETKAKVLVQVGQHTRLAKNYRAGAYMKDPKAVALNSRINQAKEEYQITPSYRRDLTNRINELQRQGRHTEAERARLKLDVLTDAYNERQARKKSVNEHMKASV